jgi:hypothetical protein
MARQARTHGSQQTPGLSQLGHENSLTLGEDSKHTVMRTRIYGRSSDRSTHRRVSEDFGSSMIVTTTHDSREMVHWSDFNDQTAPSGEGLSLMQEHGRTPPEGSRARDQHKDISIIHACSGFDFSDLAVREFGVVSTRVSIGWARMKAGKISFKRHFVARAWPTTTFLGTTAPYTRSHSGGTNPLPATRRYALLPASSFLFPILSPRKK